MEYHRDRERNQIYADLAYRLGRIVVQYDELNVIGEKYEASLYIAVLQNLLTNCKEYVENMTRGQRRGSIFKKDIELVEWGLQRKCWVENTFNEDLNLQNFIARIRNSVSHPTVIDIESTFPSTGFTTVLDNSGIIKKFRFVNSPDTNRNRIKLFSSEKEVTSYIERNNRNKEFPEDITYSYDGSQCYFLSSNNKDFIRVSIIDLSVKELGNFVKHLANYLAQPIQDKWNWDGEKIKWLLAA